MNEQFFKLLHGKKTVAVVVSASGGIDELASASALYTYMLQLHKKVVFVTKTKIKRNYLVIPWLEKVRSDIPHHTDFVIICGTVEKDMDLFEGKYELFRFDKHLKYEEIGLVPEKIVSISQIVMKYFDLLDVKINKKMATALYAGIFDGSDAFCKVDRNGMIFAHAKQLLEAGADHDSVVKYLRKYSTLSQLRLLGMILSRMELLYDAKVAFLSVEGMMLEASGASFTDALVAADEALQLPTVEIVFLCMEKTQTDCIVVLKSLVYDMTQWNHDKWSFEDEMLVREFQNESVLNIRKKVMNFIKNYIKR